MVRGWARERKGIEPFGISLGGRVSNWTELDHVVGGLPFEDIDPEAISCNIIVHERSVSVILQNVYSGVCGRCHTSGASALPPNGDERVWIHT
jgi:hypothetical protein